MKATQFLGLSPCVSGSCVTEAQLTSGLTNLACLMACLCNPPPSRHTGAQPPMHQPEGLRKPPTLQCRSLSSLHASNRCPCCRYTIACRNVMEENQRSCLGRAGKRLRSARYCKDTNQTANPIWGHKQRQARQQLQTCTHLHV